MADITSRIIFEIIKKYASFSINAAPYKPLPVKIPGETAIPMDGGSISVKENAQLTAHDGIMSVAARSEDIEKYGSLTVGTVMPGDSITPMVNGSNADEKEKKGKTGKSKDLKIRDIFSSYSIPKTLRNYMPIVRSGTVPIWIPGIMSLS